jgi:hypothetical protein
VEVGSGPTRYAINRFRMTGKGAQISGRPSANPLFMLVTGIIATCVLALSPTSGPARPVLLVATPPVISTLQVAARSTRMEVVVRPVVSVALDSSGHPILVVTNMNRPPVANDTFTIYGKGHTPAPAYAILAVIRAARSGDWSRPGVWHAL